MSATLTDLDPAPVVVPATTLAPAAVEIPGLLESALPAEHHAAYKLRLQGRPVEEIARQYGVCRETVWRWCKAVEAEYIGYLESQPTFNMVAEQMKRLRDLEEECRRAATTAKSERAKAMFLANALKAITAQNDLLLDVGVFERAPERLYKIVANVKPTDLAIQQAGGQRIERSRAELIESLIGKLSKATASV